MNIYTYLCSVLQSYGQMMGKNPFAHGQKNTMQLLDNQIIKEMEINPIAKEPMFVSTSEHVFIRAFLDTRRVKDNGTYPVYIRVTYQGEKWLYASGICLTPDEYAKAINLKSSSGELYKSKETISRAFQKVVDAVKQLNAEKRFSIDNLKKAIANPITKSKETLYEYWYRFGEEKLAEKTREQYRDAARNFYRFLGCTFKRVPDPENPGQKIVIAKGAKLKIAPTYIDEKVIADWTSQMAEDGLSDSTISIYLRAMRAVLNSLKDSNVIPERPKFVIKAGTRRKEDFITVPEIIKIRDYDGPDKVAADWWIILYLCNGSNLKDLAKMTWNEDYFSFHELSFFRGKIADKVKVPVRIPIVPELQRLLDEYASVPQKDARVFPQILLEAETELQKENRVHDFNRFIRLGMKAVCGDLKIRAITASTARNSYITTLTFHGISDAFIDSMVGHVDNKNVLRGYQGTISPKKRMKVNNLLFDDPEIDDDDND